jgi:glycosyltransferase involved in cell wall biosynthesis
VALVRGIGSDGASTNIRPPCGDARMKVRRAPHRFSVVKARPLRIAILAPPWIEIPPPGYGGVEQVVDLLCRELVGGGHAVTLFAAPRSKSAATVRSPLPSSHPEAIGMSVHEADYVAHAFDAIDSAAAAGRPFDLVHDHCGFTALAFAERISPPLVHSLHGSFTTATTGFYERNGHRAAAIVAISEAQRALAPRSLRIETVIPNPVDLSRWPLRQHKEDYLLWIGRIDADKGPHRAIEAARRAGRRLILAGLVQPGHEDYFEAEVRPAIDDDRVRFVGEVGGVRKRELFARAAALLMPIRWPEPFGMVMVEALACGTPVLAFPEGATAEIVIDGENGFLVADEAEMAAATKRLGALDPRCCRRSVERFRSDRVASRYEATYYHVVGMKASSAVHSRGFGRAFGRPRPVGVIRGAGEPQQVDAGALAGSDGR